MQNKLTKYCEDCGERTFGTGFEQGLCDNCWEKMKERKANYWRGFRACALLIAVVIVVGFVVWANIFISANS